MRGGGPQTPRARRSRAATSRRSSSRARSSRNPQVLIAAQPTRGLDVGAIEFVHRRLVEQRDEGRAVLLVSLELDEILSLSDRILVMYEGEIVGEYARRRDRGGARPRDDRRRPEGGGARERRTDERATAALEADERSGRRRRSLGGDYAPSVAARLASASAPAASSCRSLTALLAFLIGGLVVLATGQNPLTAYKEIFNGAGLNWLVPVGHRPATRVARRDQPRSRRSCSSTPLVLTGLAVAFAFRCGLFNIGGQGQYSSARSSRVWVGSSLVGHARRPAHRRRDRRAPARRRGLGRHRRLPEGDRRRARGDHDDHAQLDRDLGRPVPVRPRRAAAEHTQTRSVPVSNDVADEGAPAGLLGRPDPAGPAHRLLHRARRARRLLAHPQPHDARLRGARGRLQPRGGALRRHRRRAQLLPRDGDLGRVRRPRRRDRRPRLAVPARRRTTSRSRRSASSASRSRCSGATPPSASSSRRCSSARS